jgi:hypothetical protein
MYYGCVEQAQWFCHRLHSRTPPSLPSSSSPFTYLALLFVVFAIASFTPCHGWLLCVGQTGSDTMGIVIASRIIIVVIIISLLSPAEEHTMETCEGGRGHGGDCLGINTVPLPCCGRACKVSKRMFSWSSLVTTSLKTEFFCKNSHSYKKNKNWRLSVHVQSENTCTEDHQ